MKKYIFCLISLCCATATLPAAAAENPSPAVLADPASDGRNAPSEKEQAKRRNLAELQAKRTAQQLKLDPATTTKYVKTYCQLMEEIWQLAPVNEWYSASDKQAKKDIEQRFVRSQKVLQLRQKYYKIFSTFLAPQQIQQAYRIERPAIIRLVIAHRRAK